MTRGSTIKASKVGSGPATTETTAREPAPRQDALYRCARDCARSPFTVPFDAGATPPVTWHCRCGQTARLDGAPDDAAEASLPGYTSASEQHQKAKREPTDPWSQLRKRRSIAELDAVLAERMATVRQTGEAR